VINTTVALIILLIFSFLISYLLKKVTAKGTLLGGIEFTIVGVLLGTNAGVGILTEQMISALNPLIYLLLGLCGFFFGLSASNVKFKDEITQTGAWTSLAVFLTIGLFVFYLGVVIFPDDLSKYHLIVGREEFHFFGQLYKFTATEDHLWLAIVLAAAGAIFSSDTVQHNIMSIRAAGPVTSTLLRMAPPSEILGILIFGLALAAARAIESSAQLGLTVTEWTIAVVGLGSLCGFLFSLFIGRREDDLRVYLATVGIVTFASGIGSALGVSSLFVNFICGVVLSWTSPFSGRMYEILERLRNPLSIMLLLFAGISWVPPTNINLWLFPLTFILVRYMSIVLWARFMTKMTMSDKLGAPRVGHGLIGQDALIVAIGFDFCVRYKAYSPIVMTTILFTFVINELVSRHMMKKLLSDSCEITSVNEKQIGS
jgi:hypothetical protein